MNQGFLVTIIVIVMLSIADFHSSIALAQNMSGRIRESKVASRTKHDG